jgi:hypothetical protein
MKQTSLARHGFNKYAKTTRRSVFLNEMERIVPWGRYLQTHRAPLSQSQQWSPSHWTGENVAHLLLAAMV